MKLLLKSALLSVGLVAALPAQAAVQWTTGPGANNHWYEIIRVGSTFAQALANAPGATPIAGFTPHLVTVTSLDESNFLFANFGSFGQAWAAGSDRAVEGTWRWLAGPEAGQAFWSGGTTLTYAAWQPGEPNNSGDEDGLLLHQFGNINWNDANTGSSYQYIVEYNPDVVGAVPEPASWGMMLLGFGLVGSALRRRDATRVSAMA